MKKLLLMGLITLSSAVNACIPGLSFVMSTSVFLYTQGVATLLSEGGEVGNAIGQGIGGYIGSSTGFALASDIGSVVGGHIVKTAGEQVQHLPTEQRVGVAAGLLAAGYFVAKYGTRIVIGLPT